MEVDGVSRHLFYSNSLTPTPASLHPEDLLSFLHFGVSGNADLGKDVV